MWIYLSCRCCQPWEGTSCTQAGFVEQELAQRVLPLLSSDSQSPNDKEIQNPTSPCHSAFNHPAWATHSWIFIFSAPLLPCHHFFAYSWRASISLLTSAPVHQARLWLQLILYHLFQFYSIYFSFIPFILVLFNLLSFHSIYLPFLPYTVLFSYFFLFFLVFFNRW